ncbi:hypothetical protein EN766_12810 [Mesorhizobium sp. M2A.F.Ca.ET.046.02.1.1]|nr:hypothetical protein EN766_12810 [Mesorhizobium sp. M2A.F.Ca.ET.046.02.1.1]
MLVALADIPDIQKGVPINLLIPIAIEPIELVRVIALERLIEATSLAMQRVARPAVLTLGNRHSALRWRNAASEA